MMTLTALRREPDWQEMFGTLVAGRRAAAVHGPAGMLWCAVEGRPGAGGLSRAGGTGPAPPCPVAAGPADPDTAAADMLRGHLDCRGPSTVADLTQATGLPETVTVAALARLEEEGFAIRGRFTAAGAQEYCARRLLSRIHSYTRQRKRAQIEPVTARDFIRFLLRWPHVEPGTRPDVRVGVLSVIEQLQGFELAAGAWENAVLAARVDGYRREWLGGRRPSGPVTWGPPAGAGGVPRPGRPGS